MPDKQPQIIRGKADHLPKWKKGQSGNPNGRPKKDVTLTSLLKEEIEKICPQDKEGRTWRQLLVIATMRCAIKGESAALKEVWQRLDGRVAQSIDLTTVTRSIEDELAELNI
jgi:hypothetical protein